MTVFKFDTRNFIILLLTKVPFLEWCSLIIRLCSPPPPSGSSCVRPKAPCFITIQCVAMANSLLVCLLCKSSNCVLSFNVLKQLRRKMAATARTNAEMKRKANKMKDSATCPVERLRLACLSRGAGGIKGLGRLSPF